MSVDPEAITYHTGEDVHVVALRGEELLALVLHRTEGAATSEQQAAIRPVHGLFKGTFRSRGRVGEREDNRRLVLESARTR